jgi:hypothetical protein
MNGVLENMTTRALLVVAAAVIDLFASRDSGFGARAFKDSQRNDGQRSEGVG